MASPSKPAQLPVWARDGELVSEELKAVVSSYAKNVSSTKTEQQREGADRLYELIKSVWGLDAHFARDAADLVCDDIRWVQNNPVILNISLVTNYAFLCNFTRAH